MPAVFSGVARAKRLIAAVAAACACAVFAPPTAGAISEAELHGVLAGAMAEAPPQSGALVVDVTAGRALFADREAQRRQSASVMKLYTTSAALLRLSPGRRLATRLLGDGRRRGAEWRGDVYLRGSGDFTFGTAEFRRGAYGGGGSIEALAAGLRRAGVKRVTGAVYADTSLFGDNGGTLFGLVLCPQPLFGPGCPYGPRGKLERPIPNGPRTPIGMNRGLLSAHGAEPQKQPARFAARALARELRRHGIAVSRVGGERRTPPGARQLAVTRSPRVSRLIQLVNRPSDNYAADVLQRVIGVHSGQPGTRAGGEAAMRRVLRHRLGIEPSIRSGSGETLGDRTSPREVVDLLTGMRSLPVGEVFHRSLSLAGHNGTLLRLAGTPAAGRCRLKDGTRVDRLPNTTLNLAGYCRATNGHEIVFAIMMNGMPIEFVPPDRLESPAYALQDRMVSAIASYGG